MKLDNSYCLEYSNFYLHLYYIYNVLADMSFDLLQVFLVKLRSLYETLNQTLLFLLVVRTEPVTLR